MAKQLVLLFIFFFFANICFAQPKGSPDYIYVNVDTRAEFVGGQQGFEDFLVKNFKFPKITAIRKIFNFSIKMYVTLVNSKTIN
jgi:hypothetical protein